MRNRRASENISRVPSSVQEMGADPADVAKIDDFAHLHDLNVKSVHLASRTVKLTGTVKAMSAAFGVKLNKVKHDGATYRMRKGNVQIPAELEGIVVGVHGLDNRPVAQPHFRRKLPDFSEEGRVRTGGTGRQLLGRTDRPVLQFPRRRDRRRQCIAHHRAQRHRPER